MGTFRQAFTSPLFVWQSFRITSSLTAMGVIARLSMWLTLGFRLIVSLLTIIWQGYGGRVLSMVLGIIFGVVGFWLVAGWLGIIGSAEGRRRVFGIEWGRMQFDCVLVGILAGHVGVLVSAFYYIPSWMLSFAWWMLALTILTFAMIATRPSRDLS
ncbi:hypothetical protein B0T16DRAFT_456443 [Cercophora newfieldiana]|uniref:Uncharacterized protein n=1 Tax=Cercophora newfieldiana TaxID=92897 RepID=A0AA39YAE1_9PEZI|nr:hypothetical protein B0T16DRAFT_456443 [Cercophora newfieldiana]